MRKGKYGVIVKVPNYILKEPYGSISFEKELLFLIDRHMNIDVFKCSFSIKQSFEDDISLVRLTSTKEIKGLCEYCSFGHFIQINFPVEKVLK